MERELPAKATPPYSSIAPWWLKAALPGTGRMCGSVSGCDLVQRIDQLIAGWCLCGIAWAVLQFLPVVEEEASVVGAEGKSGDGAAASPERTAEVVPPGLAEVEAVLQGGTCDCSVSCVDGLQSSGIHGMQAPIRARCEDRSSEGELVRAGSGCTRPSVRPDSSARRSCRRHSCRVQGRMAVLWPGMKPIAASLSRAG